jgi:hypothetical protein
MGALIVSRDDRTRSVVADRGRFTSAVSLLCEAYSIW